MSGLGGETSSTAELRGIERRRTALEELVHVAQHIEALQRLLEKMLLLVKPSQTMPPQAQQFFRKLNRQTRELPDEEVAEKLDLLEAALKKHVRAIRRYAEAPDESLSGEQGRMVAERIQRLRRYGQTAVGLRVLLQKRGLAPRPLQLDLPQLLIQQRINELRKQEAGYRQRIIDEMQTLLDDVANILTAESASEQMSESLSVIEAELQRDLEHLRAGGAMLDMPSRYESIELQEEYPQAEAEVEVESPDVSENPDADESSSEDSGRHEQPGRFRVLLRWLRTPWAISWRQARRLERQRRRERKD